MSNQLGVLSVLLLLVGCAPPSSVNRVALERGDAALVADGAASGVIDARDAAAIDHADSGGAGGRIDPDGQGGAGGDGGNGGDGGDGDGGGAAMLGGHSGAPGSGGDPGAAELDAAVDIADAKPADATPVPPAPGAPAFLIVADPTAMAAADTKIKTLLAAKGFAVTIGDDDGPGTQVSGAAVVVLSGTCASEKIMAKYRDTPVATLVLEPAVFDDMMMTAAGAGKDFGEDNATQLAITAADHPLAAQLKGNVTVVGAATKLGWGNPPATAQKVATLGGMTTKTAIFAYEKAAVMVAPFVAPARRVGLFVTVTAAANLSADGEKLLAAAIGWLSAP
jgi:hypothetical protein